MVTENQEFQYQENEGVSLGELIYIVIRKWWFVFLMVFQFAAIAYVYSNVSYEEGYIADGTMVVHSQQYDHINDEWVQVNDVNISLKIVETYKVIMLSDSVMNLVNDDLETDFDVTQMKEWISLSNTTGALDIQIQVFHPDPEIAVAIANSLMENAEKVINETLEIGRVNIVDYAILPETPVPANNLLHIVIGALLGGIVGGGIILGLALLFPKTRNSKDISQKLMLNVIGEIPKIAGKSENSKIIYSEDSESHFNEAFKFLAFKVDVECTEKQYKRIIVTSAREGEGKTTVSINLSIALARRGKKVILLEFDLHKQNILNRLGSNYLPQYNFKQILYEGKSFRKNVYRSEEHGIDIFTTPNSLNADSLLLDAKENGMFIEKLSNLYDYIVIDSPPAYLLSDATLLSQHADTILMVIRQEHSTLDILKDTKERLNDSKTPLLGAVLNDIRYLIADPKYNYKKKYMSKYMSDTKQEKKSSLSNKATSFALIAFWVLILGAFTLTKGDTLSAAAVKIIDFLYKTISSNPFSQSAEDIAKWQSILENYVHLILFFFGTSILMFFLNTRSFPNKKRFLATIMSMTTIAFTYELIQSILVERRGFELSDVIFALFGIILGLALIFVKDVIKSLIRNGNIIQKTSKNTILSK